MVVGVGLALQRRVLNNLQTIGLQSNPFGGVVAHQSHLADTQAAQDLGSHAIVTLVGLVTQVQVGVDSVEALFLQLVCRHLGHQPDATSLLGEVDQHPFALLLDEL